MKIRKTVWIPLVCLPVLLTSVIVPPIVIYKNKNPTRPNNKEDKDLIPSINPNHPTNPKPNPNDDGEIIISPTTNTLKQVLEKVSKSLTSTLSNKKFKTLEKLESDISTHLNNNNNNNNSFNNISFEITNKNSIPKHIKNTKINLNLQLTGLNNNSSFLSTYLDNVSIGIYDIDEIISRKKIWIDINELTSITNDKENEKNINNFFYLLNKNNYDTLDQTIFNKDSYTYDFSDTEVKKTIVKTETKGMSSSTRETIIRTRFNGYDPKKSWYETTMKIKKGYSNNDYVDWKNNDELELKLYVFIPELYKTTEISPKKINGDDGDFIVIDKDGNERRIDKRGLTKNWHDLRVDTYDYENWKQKGWTIEEAISWNSSFGSFVFPKTIKRVPNYLSQSLWRLSFMFSEATSFNQDISSWNTSNVKYMDFMFYNAYNFNQPIDNWNTSNVTDMGYMFDGATSFNQDLSKWNTSKVREKHNQDIGYTNPNWKPEHKPKFKKIKK
ncbi:BspA family leucine-rich repeat surface protein [Mycoplasma capricolum subsp. capricolum]|uniref:BspA family leucine-rich repeat surface protein n=1 Tax=Mycoplasma capricolum TaxID=2095 RepID=UPI003DA56CA0